MENYVPKQLIRSKSGLRIVARKESLCSPFIIQEPEWIPDKEISNCMKCRTKFGFTTRKHHCRRCGQIFCNDCCDTRLELPRMCFVDPVRICVNCEPQTKIENTFFEKHVKVLTQGAIFLLGAKEDTFDRSAHCKLTQDHRYLVFDEIKIPPVELLNITSLKVTKDSVSGDNCLRIVYLLNGEKNNLYLCASNEIIQKHSAYVWMNAIQQAYEILTSMGEIK